MAGSDVAERTDHAALASTRQAEAAAKLPPLRRTEAECGAALHRLIVQRDALDAEELRAREEAQRVRQRIMHTEQDLARERALDADAQAAIEALESETAELATRSRGAETQLADTQALAVALADALAERERTLERLTSELAEWNAQKSGHERTREIAAALARSTAQQLSQAQGRLDVALSQAASAPDAKALETAATKIAEEAEALRAKLAEARTLFERAECHEAQAREPLEQAEHEVRRISAEAAALTQMLRPSQDLWPPIVDAVTVQPGYEAAFASALGDDIDAPTDEAAPHHWRNLGELEAPALPDGVQPLSLFVHAPPALARRLAMTGVVFPDQGKALQPELKPGQRLVSATGDLWRWDGFAASSEAPSTAAVRLAQRNRLTALEAELAQAKANRTTHFEAYARAKALLAEARESARTIEVEHERTGAALLAAQTEASKAVRAAADRVSELASLEAEIRRLTQTRDAALESEQHAEDALAALGDGAALQDSVSVARSETANARVADGKARAEAESMAREAATRTERLASIASERERWEARRQSAAAQIAEHLHRQECLREELAVAEAKPGEVAGKRNALLDQIAAAEAARNQAADARASAEAELANADKAVKAADAALSEAREARARAQALDEAAAARIDELRIRVREELDAAPEQLGELADIRDSHELPTLEYADNRTEKLKREREQLGGVNLRAEEEAQEQEQRLNTLMADRADLEGAIERLRRGIQSLNREGRERLLASFEKVNENFQMLFTKLFEGGEAKLTFTESEDPLEAGLEIYARPPGKRLQNLTLLSGGEQALTALSLIFAVFMVNPAPVCVLDEVDAPLDDANVERFCNLLYEMTRLTDTRFLVITHHALTMSRMHRLFGVTMAERGVSQLVSVDLAQAQQVVAAAE
ncbi:MAG: chromosome segregation protein SMC [Alphaproteobacteria bacterium]|nr:chromosome segregation protein SMC [Alphaproteobacteria bacterium]